MILLHGTSCRSDFLQRVFNQKTSAVKNQARVHPRQTNAEIDCFERELENELSGESCRFIAECESSLGIFFSGSSQSTINTIGNTFCTTECGNAVITAIEACNENELVSGIKDYFIGLCGTNADGDRCYEGHSNSRRLLTLINSCYEGFESTGECRSGCRSELNDAVDNQGCCLNVYYDFSSATTPRALHDECNVNIPDPCNNSPLSGSVSHAATIATVITAVIFYATLS